MSYKHIISFSKSYKLDCSPPSHKWWENSSDHNTVNLMSSLKEGFFCVKNRWPGMTTWPSYIEEPSISQLSSTYRNKQPYGKQTYFLLLHFICFKILQCHKSRILTTLHLKNVSFGAPNQHVAYIPTKLQNFNWLQTWNRLYVNPALPNVMLVAQITNVYKMGKFTFLEIVLKLGPLTHSSNRAVLQYSNK